jgi:hypothetical protein
MRILSYLKGNWVKLFVLAFSLMPALVSAQIQVIPSAGDVPGPNIGTVNPANIVATIFRITIEIAGAVFLVMLLFGGFTYLTSAGNEEGTTKAKKMMINAVVGLIIILAAYGIGTFILKALGYTF